MPNYLMRIEYDGTNFVGWQSQKNGDSVQDNIEKVFKKIYNIFKKVDHDCKKWSNVQTYI